ncbi:MAG: hypothetical protein LBM27_06075 [Lactobacillaceae bacterium]|jgi:hypothetical protein|nr:hypothetical protein [Lactobacillaceae bacterium]
MKTVELFAGAGGLALGLEKISHESTVDKNRPSILYAGLGLTLTAALIKRKNRLQD